MSKKTGVYICTGCGIGEALDIKALSKIAKAEAKAAFCKDNAYLCGTAGLELIKNDIANEGINVVVVGACSSRVKYEEFDFGPDVMVERANLREQVVWCHTADDEDTQMLAEDTMSMIGVRAVQAEIPVPSIGENLCKDILVVGGGLAGMTAALETAKAGYKAILVEKSDTLGGWIGKNYKLAPLSNPFDSMEEVNIEGRVKALADNPNVKVYTSATIEKIAGAPGMFDVSIKQGGNTVDERAGAIVLAAGARPYDTSKLAKIEALAYGKYPNIVTNYQMEELACSGKITRPSDGKEVQKVAFVQCAGSRDQEHLAYCSAACCVESMKQAMYVKEQNPEAAVYVFYKDIRSSGQYEHFYKAAQNTGVIFIKGDVTCITEDSGSLTIEANDVMMGETTSADELDLVVLATGMVPSTAFGTEIEIVAEGDEKKDEAPKVVDPIIKSDILNLVYRQGPELPSLKYGFPDSHFICFPYETRRTGIFAAGSVRTPMDNLQAIGDATGAAMKAIQCVELTAIGSAVHPRAGDTSHPEFFMQRCTQCKRCTEECPFGAINEDEKGNPLPNPSRCRRCGTCMGACPERIISFKNFSVPMVGSMLKAVEVPDEDEEKPRILIIACENDAMPALDMAGINRLNYNAWVRIIPVRCLGSLNLVWIADAMSKGFDGVYLIGCKHGDDYQCHFIKGSELAEIRLSKVSETLDRLQLESERVRMTQISIMDYDKVPQMLDDFAARLDELGPNPMKGF